MIVVTGIGRSGTSFVAALYRELGFDPGGEWYGDIDAGLEDHEVVRLNERIVRGLGLGIPERELPEPIRGLERSAPWLWERRRAVQAIPEMFTVRARVHWGRLDPLVAELGEELRAAAESRAVTKDPRFSWTIGVWAAAGARIDHVLVCLRNMDAMLQSRLRAGMMLRREWARNAFLYRLGLCVQSLVDHDLEHELVRFPQLVEDPAVLWKGMRFPRRVTRKDFDAAFVRVADREKVHDWR